MMGRNTQTINPGGNQWTNHSARQQTQDAQYSRVQQQPSQPGVQAQNFQPRAPQRMVQPRYQQQQYQPRVQQQAFYPRGVQPLNSRPSYQQSPQAQQVSRQPYLPSQASQPSQPSQHVQQQQPVSVPSDQRREIETVHPDMMLINSELHSRLESLEEELMRTKQELSKAEENNKFLEGMMKENEEGGERERRTRAEEEVKKLKIALQEMGRVVKFLETELQKAQQSTGDDSLELASKLEEAQAKNEEMEKKIADMDRKTVEEKKEEVKKLEDSIRKIKIVAKDTIANKDKVILDMTEKLRKSEETLQYLESRTPDLELQKDTIRELKERCANLEAGQTDSANANIKKYEDKLKCSQDQMAKLQQSLQASQGQITNLLTTLKTKESAWKAKEESTIRQYEDKINFAQEAHNQQLLAAQDTIANLELNLQSKDENKSEEFDEQIKNLKNEVMDKEVKLTECGERLRITHEEHQEDKVKLGQMELIVNSLEEKQSELETKLNLSEEEKNKLQAKIRTSEKARAILEKKKANDDQHLRNLETKQLEYEEELEDKKQKLSEMEVDCNEALAKYKDMQEKKAETDRKFNEVEREERERVKACEDHVEKYENAISYKIRYEYRINFLEERCRRLTSKHPAPASLASPGTSAAIDPDIPDVNEQFLNLLDMDTAGKYKEMEQKCNEFDLKRIETEQKLSEEIDRSREFQNINEELKNKLEKFEEVLQENVELQQKLEEAQKNDMDLFVMDAAPIVEDNKEGSVVENEFSRTEENDKDSEIISLKKELAEKNIALEREIELQKEIEDMKAQIISLEDKNHKINLRKLDEELVGMEERHKKELELLREENQTIKIQLDMERKAMQELNEDDSKADKEDLMAKYKSDVLEYTVKVEKMETNTMEMDRQLKEQDRKINELSHREEELVRTIEAEKKEKDVTQEAKQILQKELTELKEDDAKTKHTIETLTSELEMVRLKLESQAYQLQVGGELFAEHKEIYHALQSLSRHKRKRVFDNIFEETKKLRLEQSKDDIDEKAVNSQESEQDVDKNEPAVTEDIVKENLVTEPKIVCEEVFINDDKLSSPSTESLLAASPEIASIKSVKRDKPAKPTSILFCNWATSDAEKDEDNDKNSEEDDEDEDEDDDDKSIETEVAYEPPRTRRRAAAGSATLEDTVC